MKFTIELDSTVVAMRNGASVTVDGDKLSKEIVTELLAYGIGQKVRDSASQASTTVKEAGGDPKNDDEVKAVAQPLLEAAVAALYAGTWTRRGEGSSVDPRTAIGRSLMRKAMKEKFGAKSPDWATFTGYSDAEQIAKLDENIAANADYMNEQIDAEIALRAARAKSKKDTAKKVSFTI